MSKKLDQSEINRILNKCTRQRQESYDKTKEFRDEAKRIKRYAKGKMLDDDIIAVIEGRDQPVEWENTIKKISNKVMGLKILDKKEINAFGKRVIDKPAANVVTNVLRDTQDNSFWWSQKKRADFDLWHTGMSQMKPIIKELGSIDLLGVKERELKNYHIPMEQGFPDPYATCPFGTDMRYHHEVRLIDREELYPYFDIEKVDSIPLATDNIFNQTNTNTYTVAEEYSQRVMITFSWYKEFDKKKKRMEFYYVIWGEGVMLEHRKMPYKYLRKIPVDVTKVYDADPENPCEFYSPLRDIMPIADAINYTHLRIANMMGSIKMLFESDAVDDAETFMEEYELDNSIVEVKSGALRDKKIQEIKQNNDIAQLMNRIHDKRAIAEEIIGLNNEILGTSVQRLSGYAIEHRQNAGMVGLQLFIDASLKQDMNLADMGVKLINQYINAEQVYRIMDSFEADQYFVVNEIEKTPDGRVVRESGEVKRKNKLFLERYDIVLRAVPQTRGSVAERQKNWVEIMKLFAGQDSMLNRLLPRMLRDIESPVALEVLEEIKAEYKQKAEDKQAHEMQQLQAQEIMLKLEKLQAEIKEIASKTAVNNAKAQDIIEEKKEEDKTA